MGLLRFLLALAVVIAHTSSIFGLQLIGGVIAVESFFIISGFYMALILNEKYKNTYNLFITNRLLRIFPVYWAVLLLSVLVSIPFVLCGKNGLALGSYVQNFQSLNIFSLITLIFSNIFIVGQDALMFFKLNSQGFLSPALQNPLSLHIFLFVPQAWTLSLELMFYFISPLLVRLKSYGLAILILASLALRFFLYSKGLSNDPWDYRFFPNEIVFFLFGIISYKIYNRIKNLSYSDKIPQAMLSLVLGYIILFQFIPFYSFKQWFLYFLITVSIPFIFAYTKNHPKDRYVGELSYSIYISHVLILFLVGRIVAVHKFYYGLIAYPSVILFAMLLVNKVVLPFENLRQNRAKILQENSQVEYSQQTDEKVLKV
jgi:peptidoglycan/LPS O-acetylase OafA/YrhL